MIQVMSDLCLISLRAPNGRVGPGWFWFYQPAIALVPRTLFQGRRSRQTGYILKMTIVRHNYMRRYELWTSKCCEIE